MATRKKPRIRMQRGLWCVFWGQARYPVAMAHRFEDLLTMRVFQVRRPRGR